MNTPWGRAVVMVATLWSLVIAQVVHANNLFCCDLIFTTRPPVPTTFTCLCPLPEPRYHLFSRWLKFARYSHHCCTCFFSVWMAYMPSVRYGLNGCLPTCLQVPINQTYIIIICIFVRVMWTWYDILNKHIVWVSSGSKSDVTKLHYP